MAVTQWFTIELPEGTDQGDGVITLNRDGAESLWNDLGGALGMDRVTGPDTEEIMAAVMRGLQTFDVEAETEQPTGRQMSPDEALARVQAQAQVVPVGPRDGRNPGTGIGNG